MVACTSLSLSLSPESFELWEELAKVEVLSIVDGYVNKASVLEIIPSIVNAKLVGPIMPITDSSFLISYASKAEVRVVVKSGMFKVVTKDGPYLLKLAY